MEAKDLMIGDWVEYLDKCHIITKINKIERSVGLWGKLIRDDIIVPTNTIEPISLTPEILEKNGFEKILDEDGTECYRYYNSAADGYIKISLYNGGDGDWSIEIVNYEKFNDNKIVYNNNFIFLKVHQLQHLFRLCEIGKEIEL